MNRWFRGPRRKAAAFFRTAAGAVLASAPEALVSMALVGSAAVLALGTDPAPRRAGDTPHAARAAPDCPAPNAGTGSAGADALAEWYAQLWAEME